MSIQSDDIKIARYIRGLFEMSSNQFSSISYLSSTRPLYLVTDIRDTTFLILVLCLDECYNIPNFGSNVVVRAFLE